MRDGPAGELVLDALEMESGEGVWLERGVGCVRSWMVKFNIALLFARSDLVRLKVRFLVPDHRRHDGAPGEGQQYV